MKAALSFESPDVRNGLEKTCLPYVAVYRVKEHSIEVGSYLPCRTGPGLSARRPVPHFGILDAAGQSAVTLGTAAWALNLTFSWNNTDIPFGSCMPL
jgi:hypothetical protein